MLVLSRRVNEKIVFPSLAMRIQLVAIKTGIARLGIEAPPNIPIYREELLDRDTALATDPLAQPDAPGRLHRFRQMVAACVAQAQAELARLHRLWANTGAEARYAELAGLEAELRRLEALVANEST